MTAWIVAWKAVFIGGMALFAAMAAWVTVQGYRDIAVMLGGMKRGRRPRRRQTRALSHARRTRDG